MADISEKQNPRQSAEAKYCVLTNGENYCDLAELNKLVSHLAENLIVDTDLKFARGSLMTDGRLDLCKQKIGPAGAQMVADSLKSNTFVKSLMLGADAILKENQTLETIYLGCNGIDEKGAQALCAALGEQSQLKILDLGFNPLDASFKCFAE